MSAVAMARWPQQLLVTRDEVHGHLTAVGGREGLDEQRLDLCALARHSLSLLCTTGHVLASEVELALPEEPVWVRTNPRCMEQVLLHLIVDAVSTRRGVPVPCRAVRLGVEPQDDFGDYGPTIRMRYTAAGPSAQEARDVASSAPVGLTVARELVEAQGGHVAVRRQGLSGSTVTVTVELPDAGTASW